MPCSQAYLISILRLERPISHGKGAIESCALHHGWPSCTHAQDYDILRAIVCFGERHQPDLQSFVRAIQDSGKMDCPQPKQMFYMSEVVSKRDMMHDTLLSIIN